MTEVEVKKTQESLQDRLAQVIELLQRQRVVEDLTHRQEGPHHDRVENLVHRKTSSSCNASSMICTPPTSPTYLKLSRSMID